MSCVYVLISLKDGNRYIGLTNSLERRLNSHKNGKVNSTKNRLPVKLKYIHKCESLVQARLWEKRYKKSRGTYERSIKKGLLKSPGHGLVVE